ncbi:uncharacterized protein N0V89_002962 [Didymosphaeria variabile]|uniref:Uncharacterized protein n=1 Tax=Didymosphaeria variabile TaxID=1932322 RepID=A0A9W8XV91_9PLEO|nr:uncharacterized protein N0V89_002962 [Didymosphaeria variabile]KAJ4358380.1 hypothetical protein N0V89_002962 [Didymosphaeria variabile]
MKKSLEACHFAPCMHTVSPAFQTLFDKLPGQHTCPSCLIKSIIHTLRCARTGIGRRGGIFVSKEKGQADQPNSTRKAIRNEQVDHGRWTDLWGMASVQGFRVAELLEGFIEEEGDSEKEKEDAKRAVEIWREFRRIAMVMPGMKIEGEVDVELLTKYIRLMVVKLLREVEEEDSKGVPVEKVISKEVEEEDSKVAPIVRAHSQQSSVEGSPAPGLAGLRSCLKRKHTSDAINTKSRSKKRVTFDKYAAVSSDHYNIIAHPFSPTLRKQPTIESHRPNAFRETRDRQKLMRRTSMLYKPGRWSSPAGYEKQNTSWRGTEWWHLVGPFGVMKADEEKWEAQWNEGLRVASVFKEICDTWMANRKSLEEEDPSDGAKCGSM